MIRVRLEFRNIKVRGVFEVLRKTRRVFRIWRYNRIVYATLNVKSVSDLLRISLTTKWIVESRRPSIVRTPTGEIRFLPRVQSILIREGTRGRYQDFTYAYLYEIDPSIDIRRLRLGLTYLIASLRESKVFALPIDELGYEVIGLKLSLIHI